MNWPQANMCPLPTPATSLFYPSGWSQSTGFGCPAPCIKLALTIYSTYGNVHGFSIYLDALGLSCDIRNLHSIMWVLLLKPMDYLIVHLDSAVVTRGLSSCGTQAPEHVGLVVAVYGRSCSVICEILVPVPGSNSYPLHCKADF